MGKLNWAKRAGSVCVLSAVAAMAANAQTFTSLYSFSNGTSAAYPSALVQATNGSLYGTTQGGGGGGNHCVYGCGTVFKITASGRLTTLYNFCSQSNCADGEFPSAGLVQTANGDLYGTTGGGGAASSGTVFKITLSGALTTLYSFCSQNGCPDGANPLAALVQATDGNFYGTTGSGGAEGCGGSPYCGTVFKITPTGTLTTLHSFNTTDGANPLAALIQATDGNLYGTTEYGGANDDGTVFRITPSGTLTTLYSFDSADGSAAALVQATDGNLYGTTQFGGTDSEGSVFKITLSGTLTTLHSFDVKDGSQPVVGLVQAMDGNLYGTTFFGGANSQYGGTVFKITPSGMLTTLHSFCSQSRCADGDWPIGLIQDTNGKFYGATVTGGTYSDGTIFSVAASLGPFVETAPGSGKVGTAVRILGTNLTGATSVTFNGMAATFTVVSPSLITTTVPAGATTGVVQVVTPGAMLSSNVNFQVKP